MDFAIEGFSATHRTLISEEGGVRTLTGRVNQRVSIVFICCPIR